MSTTGKVSKTQEQKVDTSKKDQEQKATSRTINGMDADNAKALDIMTKEGPEAAVKHMFNPTGERQLSYAEMRMRFG